MESDLTHADLATIAQLIRRKKVSAVEVTKHSLARIETWQPCINAFIDVEREEALRRARRLDRKLAQGSVSGPLHGVPLAHKDMFYRKGMICSCGSQIRRDWRAPYDSTMMARLAAAGAVTLGRLNMSEFAAHPTGENAFFGACRNPWDAKHVTGGSSSGSAAAVAARLVYGALGSDTGGSIRIPAAFNGVCGLMPTYGLVSRYGALPRSWSLDHIGPLARTAGDCALMLDAIAGHDPNDGNSARRKVRSFTTVMRKDIRGLRIGVVSLPKDIVLPAALKQALKASRDILTSVGAHLVPVPGPDFSAHFKLCEIIVRGEGATIHLPWLRERPQDYSDYMRARLEGGLVMPATWYVQALMQRGPALAEFLDTALSKCDVVHLPTTPLLVPSFAETSSTNTDPGALAALSSMAILTRSFNYLGLPSMSVPCGFDERGLPLAFQLVARPFDEVRLLQVAHAYQGETDWHRRVPRPAPAPVAP